nr:hypothetical protein [Tanacetum cinerariifolium]
QNAENLNGYNEGQNVENQVAQNPRIQNIGNQNRLIGVQGTGNQIGNGNLMAVRAEGNTAGQNGNQIRCYNCRGIGHYARNCTARPRRRDAAYLQTQLLIAHKEKAGIQLQAEEYDLMAAAADLDEIEENGLIGVPGNGNQITNGNLVAARAEGNAAELNADLDEIKEVNANCIFMANLQQASTSGTQTDKAPVYDPDGSAEVHDYKNYDDNEIFNMFTKEEQYTELLEPIPELHQVPQNDNNVISENGLIGVPGNGNQITNGNLVAARAEGNAAELNDLDEIKEVNANCIFMANLQQASTSGTQTDKAPVYDPDGSAE